MKNLRPYIHVIAVVSMLLWGLSYIWTKIVFEYYSPLTTIFLRLVLSSAFLLLFIAVCKKFQKIRKKDYWLFLLSSLLNPFLYFIGECFGLKLVSATLSAVIIATIPVFTPIAAYIAFKQRISLLNVWGILISFLGVMVIIFNTDLTPRAEPLGILYLLGAVVAAIIYTVLLKILTNRYSPLNIIAYQNSIGVFYFLPFFLCFEWKDFAAVRPDTRLIITILELALLASSLAYILYSMTVKKLGISKANVYTNLIPVFAALSSYFMLHELFDLHKITGILIVIGGVLLTQINKTWISKKKSG